MSPTILSGGVFDVTERLGCIGCPMASDNGLADFIRYPKMVKAWCEAGKKYLATHPHSGAHRKFGDAYTLFAHDVFFDNYSDFQAANISLFGEENWKQRLEDFFKIDL